MAPPVFVEPVAPVVVVAPPREPVHKSRLPAPMRILILVVLNMGISAALWEFATNFLNPELGAVSKAPNVVDDWSLYSPAARVLLRVVTITMQWYFNYDFYDVSALSVLTNAPYAYILTNYYSISTLTVAAHMNIEVLAMAIPTYFLRPRAAIHNRDAPLRNRFLLDSVQVQLSSAALALGVYGVLIWSGLKTGMLNEFLVRHFDIPTLEASHQDQENPIAILGKTFVAAFAAKSFLLNPSIAAQPLTAAPVKVFNPLDATFAQTLKHNFWNFSQSTRTLIQQTLVLNAFVFVNLVQRLLTLEGTQFSGAAGYAGVWVLANTVIAAWFAWVGDTSVDYEPL